MSTGMRWRHRAAALLGGAALTLAPLLGAPSAAAADRGLEIKVSVPKTEVPGEGPEFTVSNAQLRWGINDESGAGAFYGGCNFLSAGRVGDTGGGRVWTKDDDFFSTRDGHTRIEKPFAVVGANGKPEVNPDGTIKAVYREVSFADRCTSADGTEVTSGNHLVTGITAVIDNGKGSVDPVAQKATITWEGSFTVVAYGGLVYWQVSDPVLTLDKGHGTLTATASGYGSDRDDTTKWAEITARTVDLAALTGIDLSGRLGFTTEPLYRGVRVTDVDPAQVRTGADWGAFPQKLVDFHELTGLSSYFYSSGGTRDPLKVATALWVSYDADAELPTTPNPGTGSGASTTPLPGGGGAGGGSSSRSGGSGTHGEGAGQGGLPAQVAGLSDVLQAGPALAAAVAAVTVFPLLDTFIPGALAAATQSAIAWSVAGLLTVAASMVIGFRRGWLRWP